LRSDGGVDAAGSASIGERRIGADAICAAIADIPEVEAAFRNVLAAEAKLEGRADGRLGQGLTVEEYKCALDNHTDIVSAALHAIRDAQGPLEEWPCMAQEGWLASVPSEVRAAAGERRAEELLYLRTALGDHVLEYRPPLIPPGDYLSTFPTLDIVKEQLEIVNL
jgi:hypothetical protein